MQATDVWIKTDAETLPGTIITTAATPQSYYVETPNGEQLQRNRAHLNVSGSGTSPNRICQKDSSQPIPQTRSSIYAKSDHDQI